MPESKKRRKNGEVAHEDTEIHSWTDGIPPSPQWWAPVFLTFLLLGLVWVLVYYISQAQYPIPGLNWWNLVIGLGSMLVGLFMLMRWR
ncbi:cell division protein CrgA [Schaalia sp. 19OD2882]|uniref:cell division protein CrgA n=1 Tax=Schaalia sp. 19OD2882 TaxID=2794089 RepID=UPI001C1EEEEB|nr:cell division protein CrgA [Schaalia sp. 19OD2882]QWW19609.1 cell division protein CrgA [Schaalia sp. 19OD2882]